MRSYAVTAFAQPIEPVETPDLKPTGTEVVLEVTRCGVCHTDLHLQDGFYDLGGGKRLNLVDRGIVPPVTLGHEVLGRLVSAGPDAPVAQSAIGDSFLVYPWIGCGTCPECDGGRENLCAAPQAIGVARAGGYAEQCLVPHPRYLVEVGDLDPTLAATYSCSGLTAYSALRKINIDKDDDLLLLVGLGGVGMSGLHLAQALGYQRIAVADIDAHKREAASTLGVQAIDPRDAAATATLTGLAAAAVDFVGTSVTTALALGTLRKGGECVVVGLFGGELSFPLPALVQRSLTVRGSFVGSLEELRELVVLATSGRLAPLPVEKVRFEAVNDALERLRSGTVQGRLVLSRESELR
jgi:D-arabinose 1-dehydrogenase-like Zn-dependent alcohol dehydrogenase